MTDRDAQSAQSERVEALLEEMRTLCTQIDEIGNEQQRLLDADQLEEFVASLNARNPKIQTLAQTSELVEKLLESDGVSINLIQSARSQLGEMSSMVEAILKRDADQQSVVEKRRDELSKQLSGVGTSRNAMRAYRGANRQPNPTLQDRKG
jgi:DNA repair exonuclease SbcCD ATPase subunit